jgi:aerobic carbon-monoxide dehydrogenase large subunit
MPAPGPAVKNDEGISIFSSPRGALADDRVRYVGDPIAFVVAGTVAQAKDAAELIDIDYEPLPANTDTAKALEAGTPVIWEARGSNLCFLHEVGDRKATEDAFAKAAHVVRQRFVINRVTANSMEPRGCAAIYDAREEFCTVYMATQGAFGGRRFLATMMGMPEASFRVIPGDLGGSFGMKASQYPEYLLTVWAAKRLGRPVKWTAERSESLVSDTAGRDNISEGELALDKDGKFLALRVTTIGSVGAYTAALAAGPLTNNLGTLAGVYTLGAAYVRVQGVFTNNTYTNPYRGAGRPEAAYIVERLVDLAARKVGIDGVTLRRKNMIAPSAMPYKTALTFTYDSGEFEKVLDLAVEKADVAGFEVRRVQSAKDGKLRGLGLSYTIERAGPPGLEHAEINFDQDGTAYIAVGTTNNGQGHETIYAQLMYDRFGLMPDKIRIVEGDTGRMALGQGTGGSRVSAMGMSALHLAAEKIIAKARTIAAHALETSEKDLEFKDGKFTVAGTDRTIAFSEVVKIAYTLPKLPRGIEPGLFEAGTHRSNRANYPNGCHVCEVEIDPETGKAALVRYVVIDDVGTVLNPMLLKGQIHGGIAQGAGQILMEDLTYDPVSGQVLAGSFMDYAMPRADDLCNIEVKSHPVPTDQNPLGVKGAGEAGTVGAMPAVMNALVDALQSHGIVELPMPATPERIWRALQGSKAA